MNTTTSGELCNEPAWPRVPVFFATTDGQSERVAGRFVQHLREQGLESAAFNLASEGKRERSWDRVQGVILCASVHVSGHQRCAIRFAKAHRAQLARVPSLFASVCLAIHSVNPDEWKAARAIACSFGEKTGWRPDRTACIAGRLAYTKYGWLRRSTMKRIAAAEGGSTDTSQDHEYTDWKQVERLARELGGRLNPAGAMQAAKHA